MVAVDLPPEIAQSFVAEARRYLPQIAESLGAVGDRDRLLDAYRFAHTIKSSAAMMGHLGLSQVAELLEADLEGFACGEPATPAHLAQLGRSLDRIGRLLDAVAGEPVDEESILASEVADRLDQTAAVATDQAGEVATDPPPQVPLVPFDDQGARVEEDEQAHEAVGQPGAFHERIEMPPAAEELRVPVPAAAEVSSVAGAPKTANHEPPATEHEPLAASQAPGAIGSVTLEPVPRRIAAGEAQASAPRPSAWDAASERPTQNEAERSASARQADVGEAADEGHTASGPAGGGDRSSAADVAGEGQPRASDLLPLLDELAESVLALDRQLGQSPTVAAQHSAYVRQWLDRFEQAAGIAATMGTAEADYGAKLIGRNEPGSDPSSAARPTSGELAFELDPRADDEAALRRTIEAELRFQIEEEVRKALDATRETESPSAAGGLRIDTFPGSALPGKDPQALPSLSVEEGEVAVRPSSFALRQRHERVEHATDDLAIDPEMRVVFALEAEEHLKRIGADVAALDAEAGNLERLQSLRRTVHTLKGAAAMMGFGAVAELSHSLEDRLDGVAAGAGPMSPAAYAQLLQDLEQLEHLVRGDVRETPAGLPAGPAAPAAAADGFAEAAPEAAPIAVPVRLDQLDDLLRLAGEASVSIAAWQPLLAEAESSLVELRQSIRRVNALLDVMHENRLREQARPAGVLPDAGDPEASPADFDPLELDRYTPTDHVTRELAEIAAETFALEREIASALEAGSELVAAQRHQTVLMQDRLLGVRLIPLNDLADRLQRAARGVALRRNKEVRFVFEGGRVAVDRAIVDPIADALVHLVRNAVDHGIELPEVRAARGKPAAGLVRVVARQEQGEVVVEVADDGGGIDTEKLLAAAQWQPGPGADRQREALALIFQPGISTAPLVDEVSGRGVGLDAVRAAIGRVRGSIDVRSEPARGTTFVLRFPITLAQARVVLAEAAGNPVALPAASVRRVSRWRDITLERFGGAPVARLDAQAYRVASLAETLGYGSADSVDENPPVIFVEAAGKRAALVASAIGGHQEVVVKSTGTHLRSLRGVAGATLLQDGRVALLLHLPELLADPVAGHGIALRPEAAGDRRRGTAGPTGHAPAGELVGLKVLVVDDSPTIRKLLVRMLKDLGWQPFEARDGAEALEAIRVDQPDIVLADIEMPRLDGYGLLAALRAQPATAALPVVMLTSRTAQRHRQRAMELGASGYLTKPYRAPDVVAALRAALAAAPSGAAA